MSNEVARVLANDPVRAVADRYYQPPVTRSLTATRASSPVGAFLATLAFCFAVFVGGVSVASAQAPAGVTTTEVPAVSTSGVANLDDTTVAAKSPPQSGVDSAAVDAENRRLVAIVAGLVAVAIALFLLTIRYWRVTKPVPPELASGPRPAQRPNQPVRPATVAPRQDSAPPVLEEDQHDHLDDQYEDFDDQYEEDFDDQYEDGDFEEYEEDQDLQDHHESGVIDDDLEATTTVAAQDDRVLRPRTPPRPGRRSRRAVAGADHAGADQDWEPRSTGEQAAVEPPPTLTAARPSRSLRSRMLDSADDTKAPEPDA